MGIVICMGCRVPLGSCECSFINEAEDAEKIVEGECESCHVCVEKLYPVRINQQLVGYACDDCVPRKCHQCNLVRVVDKNRTCAQCAQEREHWS